MITDIKKLDKDSMKAYNVWPAHEQLLRTCGEGICNFKEEMLSAFDIDMISLFFRSEDELRAMRRQLSEVEEINVAGACDYNIEITYEKAGKGNALLALAKKLSIEASDVIAIGDSENDLPMILAAGLGLAPENASQNVKSKADFVVCSNDENVMPFIIKKYF
jgi:hydroxymethylpyrimidine pyrophosphatase-like HAD family hydrolase